MTTESIIAIHAWWRYSWRITLTFLVSLCVVIPLELGVLMLGVQIDHQVSHPLLWRLLGVLLVLAILAAAIMFLITAAGRIMGGPVFQAPFTVRNQKIQCTVIRDYHPQVYPLNQSLAWSLLWGQYWRGALLSLPFTIERFLFPLHQAMPLPVTPLGLAQHVSWLVLLYLPIGVLTEILAFWWLIKHSYGRATLRLTPFIESVPLEPLPADTVLAECMPLS